MDEKKRILKLIEKPEEMKVEEIIEKTPKISHPNQTSPIRKNMAKFVNEKIGEKFSIKDLLR